MSRTTSLPSSIKTARSVSTRVEPDRFRCPAIRMSKSTRETDRQRYRSPVYASLAAAGRLRRVSWRAPFNRAGNSDDCRLGTSRSARGPGAGYSRAAFLSERLAAWRTRPHHPGETCVFSARRRPECFLEFRARSGGEDHPLCARYPGWMRRARRLCWRPRFA